MTPLQARDGLRKCTLHKTALHQECPKIPKCNKHYKYRTLDGSCNNLLYPMWGKSFTQFQRLVPTAYADGLNELRRAHDGSELPGARVVSLKV